MDEDALIAEAEMEWQAQQEMDWQVGEQYDVCVCVVE